MASTFLKSNFKSMNMSEEEKKKLAERKAKFDQSANELRKNLTDGIKGSISDAEVELLKDSVPSDILKIKKLLEEDK